MGPPWTPDDRRWSWLFLGVLIAFTLALMFGGAVFGQPGDPRPSSQTIPIMAVDTSGRFVLVGDLTNHALRVNVVAGSGGGPSGTIGAAFPSTVAPAGARDASGFLASFTVTNAGRLNVTCDNCGGGSTFAAAFPSTGVAIGFRDGGGSFASAAVDNAGNQFVIASQSSSAWVVSCSNCSSSTNYAATFPSAGLAVGFKDGVGRFASATVDNAGFLLVIASQGNANVTPWNVAGNVNAVVTSSALPAGASTDASVQNVEAAIREPLKNYGATFSTNGFAITARDSGGFAASLTVSNTNALNVTCDNCTSTGGTNSSYAAAFPSVGTAAGFKDGGGKMASASVDNAGNLFVIASQSSSAWTVTATGTITAHQGDTWTVTCTNCTGSTTSNFAAVFPAAGFAMGFKDGAGRMASATVDNASNLFVIASQGATNWTVTATGTVTAHQGDVWTVGLSTGSNTIGAVTGPAATASQASGNPLRVGFVYRSVLPTLTDGQLTDAFVTSDGRLLVAAAGLAATGSQANGNPVRVAAVAQTTGRTLTDGQVGDFSLTTSSDLRVRDDTSAATGTLAPSRVQMQGGMGRNGVATAVTVCDQFATVSMGWQTGNHQVITGPATGQIHICSIMLIAASATSVSIFEGSGTLCNTNRTPIFGSTATVNGLNLATTGGFTMGSGVGDIAHGQYTGSNVCIGNSTAAVVTGGIRWTSY